MSVYLSILAEIADAAAHGVKPEEILLTAEQADQLFDEATRDESVRIKIAQAHQTTVCGLPLRIGERDAAKTLRISQSP